MVQSSLIFGSVRKREGVGLVRKLQVGSGQLGQLWGEGRWLTAVLVKGETGEKASSHHRLPLEFLGSQNRVRLWFLREAEGASSAVISDISTLLRTPGTGKIWGRL